MANIRGNWCTILQILYDVVFATGNQDGDKKCVCMVLVGTSDTDDVASPSVQCVNFHNVDAENNISRLKQNKSPWVARSVIEKLKIDGKSHEK